MERIVITGATGFLGRNLAKLFLEKGYQVFALVRPDSGHTDLLPVHPNLQAVRCPLEETERWVKEIGHADGFLCPWTAFGGPAVWAALFLWMRAPG